MKIRYEILICALALVLLLPAVQAGSFNLDPSDSHWIKEEDPDGTLTDMGSYWISASLESQQRGKIYFTLPEVSTRVGELTFYYAKDTPNSMGWDKLELFISQSQSGPYTRVWASPEWGYRDFTPVTVVIPAGYTYLYFFFGDGDYDFEVLKLQKSMVIDTGEPTPTPTTPTVTPTLPATPTFDCWMLLIAIIAIVIAVYLAVRR
jgi:hypothetical protein